MTVEIYTLGAWRVKGGKQSRFIEAWPPGPLLTDDFSAPSGCDVRHFEGIQRSGSGW